MALNEVREKISLRSFFDFFLLGSLLSLLLFSPWFYGLARFRDQLASELFISTMFLISFPFLDWKNIFQRGGRQIDFWIFLTLAISLLYVIFSVLPYRSFLAFLQLSNCILFYLLARGVVRTEGRLRFFLWLILVCGVFYSVYGLAQYFGFFPRSYWYQQDSLASRYVNSGHFGAFLLFPLFGGMSLLISSRRLDLQLILVSFLLLIGWALLLTRCRAVWIAFFIGFSIFVWLAWRNKLLKGKGLFAPLVLVTLACGLLLMRGGLDDIFRRFNELRSSLYTTLDTQTMSFYSLIYRWNLWKGAFRAISEDPWGWGLGTFSAIFPQYRVHADRFFVDYAHNEFLQTGVDLGVPGILLLAGFLLFYPLTAFSFLKKEEALPFEKTVGIGFVALWTALFLVSQVDFPLRIYATSLFFAVFLALSANLFGAPNSKSEMSSRSRHLRGPFRSKLFQLGVFILIFLAVFFTARQLFAEIHFEKGQKFEKDFNWEKALGEYETAARLSPLHEEYYGALGSLYERRAAISFRLIQKRELQEKAIRAYQQAVHLQPYNASSHYLLARLYESKGDLNQAKSGFKEAITLESTNALYVSEYGYFALRHSMVEEAIGAFEKFKSIPFKENVKAHPHDILRKCYRLTQDYEELKRLITDNAEGHHSLGLVLAENGRWDLAKIEFDLAIREAASENHEQGMRQDVTK